MKRIGLMVAVEMNSVLKSGFDLKGITHYGKFDVYEYAYSGNAIFAIHSGAGQTFAAAATEILISVCHVDYVINFGVVGSLRDEISSYNVCLVDRIIDYQFDTSELDHCEVGQHEGMETYMETDGALKSAVKALYPDIPLVTDASGNKFVGTAEEKKLLAGTFDADIVEMEAASIEVICRMHGVSAVYIKGIADSLTGGADEYYRMLDESSDLCFSVIRNLIEKGF